MIYRDRHYWLSARLVVEFLKKINENVPSAFKSNFGASRIWHHFSNWKSFQNRSNFTVFRKKTYKKFLTAIRTWCVIHWSVLVTVMPNLHFLSSLAGDRTKSSQKNQIATKFRYWFVENLLKIFWSQPKTTRLEPAYFALKNLEHF